VGACTHPLCKAGVCSEVPFYGPVEQLVVTHHLTNTENRCLYGGIHAGFHLAAAGHQGLL
ncbi:MAG: hypothetical protein K5651_09410, partial [Bacteroidales bacterium]|nr:hypothetical protein [Bacteroidales bacterium]